MISAGAALNLVKRQGMLPGQRIVITGRGLILIALAAELIAAGGNVVSVLEASPGGSWWKTIGASLTKPDVALEGMGYWARILRHHTRYRTSHLVTRALGSDRVEEIVIQRVDPEWRPIAGTEERMPVDTLCVGYGFVPSAQLFRLAGCEGKWRPESRAWLPLTDDYMRTSVEGIFAAGDGAAPEGVDIAESEGRVAGLTAVNELGRLATRAWEQEVAKHQAKLATLRQFRRLVDSLFRLGKETDALLSEDTLICRCEDITWGELQAVLEDGARDLNTVKRWTRVGMGRCQGRNCEPTLAYLVQKHLNVDWADVTGFTCRFPVKPIPLSALSAAEDQ